MSSTKAGTRSRENTPFTEDRFRRFRQLQRLLANDIPTLGEFAMAANNENIWIDSDLENAIRDATDAGLHLPRAWQELSKFALRMPWSRDPAVFTENLGSFLNPLRFSLYSGHLALVWSALFIVVDTFPRILDGPGDSTQAAEQLLDQLHTCPTLLNGAGFECELIWLGIRTLRKKLRISEPRLAQVLNESRETSALFQRAKSDWHPGKSIGLDPYVGAKRQLLKQLTDPTTRKSVHASVVAADFRLSPYLTVLYDYCFSLGRRLPTAAYEDKDASVTEKRKALKLAGLWEISAWEASRMKRLWEEERGRKRHTRDPKILKSPVHQEELSALDYAVKNFRARGFEQTAAALASLLTSYVWMDRDFILKGKTRAASQAERDAFFRRQRSKHGQLIKQLGFELVGGAKIQQEDIMTSEAQTVETLIAARKIANRSKPEYTGRKTYEFLHEEIAQSVSGEQEDWQRLLHLVAGIPSLKSLPGKVTKLTLFRLLFYALDSGRLHSAPPQTFPLHRR